jgi:hypothetical protein
MGTEAITINDTEITLTAAGFMTWTATDISLRLRPNMTWRATRNDLTGVGATAQEAADNLIAAECKMVKAAAVMARSSKGQIFAREMRAHLHIGARTRRFDSKKWQQDGHRDVMQTIADANNYPTDSERETIFRTAFAALCSWEKHIDGCRADARLVAHISSMTPHQFVGLIADMIDAEITNVGQGELFFADMARRLFVQAA